MGLNDDVNNEYAALDGDSVIKAVDKPAPDFRPVPESDVFDEPTVAGEVPKFTAIFELEDKRRNDVSDIVEVRSTIARNCGVCTEDANVVNNLVEGFISDERPIALFSEEPTKIQYEETMQSLDAELTRQVEAMTLSLVDISHSYATHCKKLASVYTGKYPLLLARLNSSIAKMLFALEKDEVKQISYTFNNRVRWSQLMEYPLANYFQDAMDSSAYRVVEEFAGSFLDKSSVKFTEILKNRSVLKTLELLASNQGHYLFISGQLYAVDEAGTGLVHFTGEGVVGNSNQFTMGNLFRLLESDGLYKYIRLLESVFAGNIQQLAVVEGLTQEINASNTSVNEKIEALVALSTTVSEIRHNAAGIMNIQSGVYRLLEAMTCMVEDLAQSQGVTV